MLKNCAVSMHEGTVCNVPDLLNGLKTWVKGQTEPLHSGLSECLQWNIQLCCSIVLLNCVAVSHFQPVITHTFLDVCLHLMTTDLHWDVFVLSSHKATFCLPSIYYKPPLSDFFTFRDLQVYIYASCTYVLQYWTLYHLTNWLFVLSLAGNIFDCAGK